MRYETVVKALWVSDPEFVELAKALYGDSATVENVIKNKTAQDYENRRKHFTQAAIGGAGVSLAGAHKMGQAKDTIRESRKVIIRAAPEAANKPPSGRRINAGLPARAAGHALRTGYYQVVAQKPDPAYRGMEARSAIKGANIQIGRARSAHASAKQLRAAGAAGLAVAGAGAIHNKRKRDQFTKMGPDASSVHVPGNTKRLRRINERPRINKAMTGIPQRDRTYVRDDGGRFSSAAHSVATGIASGVGGGASAFAGYKTGEKAKAVRTLLARAKTLKGGRKSILTSLAASGASTAGYGLLTGASAGLSAKGGVSTYENVRDRAKLELEHKSDVKDAARRMDSEFYYDGAETPRTVTTSLGNQKPATTRLLTKTPKKKGAKFTRPMDDLVREKTADDYDDSDPKDDDEIGKQRYGVAKSEEFTVRGDLTEVDQDKRQVFGWANVTHIHNLPIGDHQGDVIPEIEELEKAAYHYVLNSRIGGGMHWRVDDDGRLIAKNKPHHVSDMIESVVFTPEKIEKMGISSDKVGWWVGFQVNDDDAWSKVKDGTWSGFSIHGAGRRTPLGDDFKIYDAEIGKSYHEDEIKVPKLRDRAQDWDTDELIARGATGVGLGELAYRSGRHARADATKLLRSKAKTAPKGVGRAGQQVRRVAAIGSQHGGRATVGVGAGTLAAAGYGLAVQHSRGGRRR